MLVPRQNAPLSPFGALTGGLLATKPLMDRRALPARPGCYWLLGSPPAQVEWPLHALVTLLRRCGSGAPDPPPIRIADHAAGGDPPARRQAEAVAACALGAVSLDVCAPEQDGDVVARLGHGQADAGGHGGVAPALAADLGD